jgi:hypothetical protein
MSFLFSPGIFSNPRACLKGPSVLQSSGLPVEIALKTNESSSQGTRPENKTENKGTRLKISPTTAI